MVMDPSVGHRYEQGFTECAGEVNRYLATIDGIDSVVKSRLVDHLNNCRNSMSASNDGTTLAAPSGSHNTNTGASLGQKQPQVAVIQQFPVAAVVGGPLSPPLYGQMFEMKQTPNQQLTQCSPVGDLKFHNCSNMYSSSSGFMNENIIAPQRQSVKVVKKPYQPEATVTRENQEHERTVSGTYSGQTPHRGGLKGDSHIGALSEISNTCKQTKKPQQSLDKPSTVTSQSLLRDKENQTTQPQRHFTGHNYNVHMNNRTLQPLGQNEQREIARRIGTENQSCRNSFQNSDDVMKVSKKEEMFSQNIVVQRDDDDKNSDNSMWRPW